jgi:hypothetical protein
MFTTRFNTKKKEEGKFRLIHDLYYPKGDSVNSAIPTEYTSVSYENIETVIHLVQQHGHNCLMAKSDIEDAFRLLPIHPDDHHPLGFTWEGTYYYDTCLPMDCSSSCQLLDNFSGKLCFLFDAWISSDTLRLYSDAAGVHGGYAAVFGSNWFTGEWSPAMQPFHITIKELFPIVLAVVIWGNVWTNHKLLFSTDIAAVDDIINNTTSKDKVIMKLVRRLILAALKYNIFFRAKHIPGKINIVCDLLSRFSFQKAHSVAPWLAPQQTTIPTQLLSV